MPELNYTPDGKVLRAFMRSNAYVLGIRGPVGSGKTASCCVELFRRSAAQAPSPQDQKRHTRHVVIRNTQPELKTTTIKTWLDWFPEAEWGRFNWQPPFTHHIQMGDIDMEVLFLALDSDEDVKKLYSLEVAMAWMLVALGGAWALGREMDGQIIRAARASLPAGQKCIRIFGASRL